MDLLNRAFCEVMLAGDAKGRVFTFPIPTYNITKDFDWDNPKLTPLWEMTAKYGIPYFANFINSDMNPEDARSMCCRLRIDNRELRKRGGGLFGSAPLTGSIGVVTINLPRLGYLSKDEEEFFKNLLDRMETARESLEIKRKVIERFTAANLYPYMSFYLRSVKERFGKYWTNHFSTIGLVGLNEAAINLFGEDIGTEKGRAFAEKVLTFMRETLVKFQEETGNNYNLEATPAEGTTAWPGWIKNIIRKLSVQMSRCTNKVIRLFIPTPLSCRLIIPTMYLKCWTCKAPFRPNTPVVPCNTFSRGNVLKI